MARKLSQELQEKAAKELNEVQANVDNLLSELRGRIQQIPHLKSRQEDQFLIAFLRSAKFDVEKAAKKIEMYYTCRTSLPELMTNRDPLDPKIRSVIKLGVGLPLPVTSDNQRVVLVRAGCYDANVHSIVDVMKVLRLIDLLLKNLIQSLLGRQHDQRHSAAGRRQCRDCR